MSVLDPDLNEIGPQRVREYAKENNLFITAGVDAPLLHAGPVEAIVERIKVYIENFGKDGRCMIHLNQIPGDTPPEHVHAAVAACHTYGRLPLDENLDSVQIEIPSHEDFSDFVKEKNSG